MHTRVRVVAPLLLLLLAGASTARAQKTAHVGQEARVADQAANRQGVFWLIEVRDRCTTMARQEALDIPCSEWRPMTPQDGERRLLFKGEVQLSDGRTIKIGRRGEMLTGGGHGVSARYLTDTALDVGDDWPLEYFPDAPGTWWLPADRPGQLFLDPDALAASAGGWLVELTLQSPDLPMSWSAGGFVEVISLSPEELAASGPVWRCEALENWLAEQPTLTADDALDSWVANLDTAAPACPETAKAAREVVCGAGESVAQEVLLSGTVDEMLARLPDCRAVASCCPLTPDSPISVNVARRYESEARQGKADDLQRIMDGYGSLMGDLWLEQAQALLAASMDAELDRLIARGDEQAIRTFVLDQGPRLGDAWQDEALSRHRWVQARKDLRIVEVPTGQLMDADLHAAQGTEQIMRISDADGAGILDIRTADGASLAEVRTGGEAYHLVFLVAGGPPWLIRSAVSADDPEVHEFSWVKPDDGELREVWTGLFEGGEPVFPTVANFVPVDGGGWGLLFSHPEYLPDPACRGRDCDHRDQAIGMRMRTEFLVFDPLKGELVDTPPPPTTDTLRTPDGRKRRTGWYHEGLRSGVWTLWHPNGAKAIEGVYREGQRHSVWAAWYPDGQKLAEQSFSAGQASSTLQCFDEAGQPITAEQLRAEIGRDDPFFIPSVSEKTEP